MTTTRASTAIAVAILAAVALIAIPGPAFADPAKPAPAPAADKKPAAPPAAAPGDKPSDKKEVVSEAEAKKFVDFFDKLVAIVVTNQDDCPKMATGINGHISGNQALVKELNDPKNSNKELPPASKEHIDKKVREELAPAMTKKCATDKTVEAAFKRMSPGAGK
ncbi:MAG TPA: hypothetical protein VHW23_45030 [Kofleriaceae bacterium]|nr:hypothetical protein [Kofleriaceae bacterium]